MERYLQTSPIDRALSGEAPRFVRGGAAVSLVVPVAVVVVIAISGLIVASPTG